MELNDVENTQPENVKEGSRGLECTGNRSKLHLNHNLLLCVLWFYLSSLRAASVQARERASRAKVRSKGSSAAVWCVARVEGTSSFQL